ncbi:hypothetical protein Mmc1_2271 [Magnetococcus marinus MC-1]|uniref:Chemoreceptor zinc-binding domain-containing protein n=1 Tax=Magnetococcus marinus (strain ATCC BAA-1437 / JCM 17883 / MC-1) TaxID=156889 RepID=A0L9X9_MAGMM|nr:CZB domain-containing protein [Magnetococcus marinus]ABK44772.1 hypothetical protein Mmc1_2271 [Magnetococcus marinus MC-1]
MIDLSVARMLHLDYEFQLEKAIQTGKVSRVTSSKIHVSHHQCELGLWLDRFGLDRYQHFPEMASLYEHHKRFHSFADQAIRSIKKGDSADAGKVYSELKEESRELIYLMTLMEYRLLHEQNLTSLLKNPMRILRRVFG